MNQPKQPTDLDQSRAWLERAAEDHAKLAGALDRAYIAAMIGDGYARLATGVKPEPLSSLRLTSEMPPGLIAAVERAQRAAAEARPHDDEPKAHIWQPYPDANAHRCTCAIGRDHYDEPTPEGVDRG